jgi:hypothetical protein
MMLPPNMLGHHFEGVPNGAIVLASIGGKIGYFLKGKIILGAESTAFVNLPFEGPVNGMQCRVFSTVNVNDEIVIDVSSAIGIQMSVEPLHFETACSGIAANGDLCFVDKKVLLMAVYHIGGSDQLMSCDLVKGHIEIAVPKFDTGLRTRMWHMRIL